MTAEKLRNVPCLRAGADAFKDSAVSLPDSHGYTVYKIEVIQCLWTEKKRNMSKYQQGFLTHCRVQTQPEQMCRMVFPNRAGEPAGVPVLRG